MICPRCQKEIPDAEIKRHSASLAGKKSRRTISPEAQAKMQGARKKRGLTKPMPTLLSRAPWTDTQVAALQNRQDRRDVDPYTCPSTGVLIPTSNGWVCNGCDYQQDWAWKKDTEYL